MDDRWAWMQIVYRLMEKMSYTEDQVYDMNFISMCNWLSFFKERDDIVEEMSSKNKNTLSM